MQEHNYMAWLEVSLDALGHNMRTIRALLKDAAIMAVVKADAYGMGAPLCAKAFVENGASMLAVSVIQEGIELRRAGIKAPILLLNYTNPAWFDTLAREALTPTIFSLEDAKALSIAAKRQGRDISLHIKIDSGMGRLGFLPTEESIQDILRIAALPHVKIEGIFTHFANAGNEDISPCERQFARFAFVLDGLLREGLYIPYRHVANSAAILDMPQYHLNMVRPGIILFGAFPSGNHGARDIPLKNAMALKARISSIKTVPPGEGISYGHLFITKRESRIAQLPLGYADGYPRALTGKASVYLNGQTVPVAGRICMDQTLLDITDASGVCVGDEAVLFGDPALGHPLAKEVATLAGTIQDDMLSSISRRIPRVYTQGGKVIAIRDAILDSL